jgi:hypothetical membrane protein
VSDLNKAWQRWLLTAGLIPLPWFLIWVSLAGVLSPGYDAITQHASELTKQPGLPHLLFNVSGIGVGVGFCLFSVGLWRATGKAFSFGAAAWFVFGVSMLSNGIWPMGNRLHGLYAVGIINLVAPVLSLLELRQLRDIRSAYIITVFVSVAAIVYLWLNLTGLDPEWARGLTQRLFSSTNSLWPAVIAIILLRPTAQAASA